MRTKFYNTSLSRCKRTNRRKSSPQRRAHFHRALWQKATALYTCPTHTKSPPRCAKEIANTIDNCYPHFCAVLFVFHTIVAYRYWKYGRFSFGVVQPIIWFASRHWENNGRTLGINRNFMVCTRRFTGVVSTQTFTMFGFS